MPAYERTGHGLEFERVAFFSDAVFAIAMTLLVVGIGVPTDDFAAELRERRPEILAFFISFVVLGNYWIAHHRFFALLRRVDSALILLNLAYLSAIAFIPFPTALVGQFDAEPIAVVLYAVALGFASLMETVMYVRAYRSSLLIDPPGHDQYVTNSIASLLPVLVFAGSIPIALWSTNVALLSWLLVFPLEAILGRMRPGVDPAADL